MRWVIQWKEACTAASKPRLGNELIELVNAAVFDEEGVDAMWTRLEKTRQNQESGDPRPGRRSRCSTDGNDRLGAPRTLVPSLSFHTPQHSVQPRNRPRRQRANIGFRIEYGEQELSTRVFMKAIERRWV